MKWTYRLHDSDSEPGKNEQLYTEMSQKGWHLKKRGSYLSRFEKGEPMPYLYRIEYSSPRALEDTSLSEEQLAFYKECGLTLVAQRGLLHVFRADADSGIGELYSDPKQQAETVKTMRRRTITAYIWPFCYLAIWVMLGMMMTRSGDYFAELAAQIRISYLRFPPMILLAGCLLVGGMVLSIYEAVQAFRLYSRLKHGYFPRRERQKVSVYRVMLSTWAVAAMCCVVLLIAQVIGVRSYDMPKISDGAYLTLSEIRIEGERTTMPYKEKSDNVEYTHSLVAECWDTYECVKTDGDEYWMYQDVYVLADEKAAADLIPALMYEGTFSNEPAEWNALLTEFEGIDEAYEGHADLEYLIRKGNTVWYITCDADAKKDHAIDTKLLSAIAGK